jgi:TonB family protein
MKAKSILALSLGLLFAPFALLASTPEKSYVESYHARTDIPVPISVVTPSVAPEFAGHQVELEFVVNTAGKPTSIASLSPEADRDLVKTVIAAVAQWKFSPALVDGEAVARKVVLPVTIVDPLDDALRYAAR